MDQATQDAPTKPPRKATPRAVADPGRRVVLRVCWPHDMPVPRPGFWLASKSGRVAYRVVDADVIHYAINSPKPRVRLRVAVHPTKDVPTGTELASWSLTRFRRPIQSKDPAPSLHHHKPAARPVGAPSRAAQPPRDPREMPAYRAVSEGAGSAQPAAWADPEDLGRYGRHARLVKGYRSKCVLRTMRMQSGSGIKDEHIVAADYFRLDHDIARLGRSAGRDFLEQGGPSHKGPVSGPSALAEEQVHHDRSFRRTLRFLQPLRPELLLAVVLGNKSVAAWCRDQEKLTGKRLNRHAEMGRLITMLDALAGYHATDIRQELQTGYPTE